MILCSFFIQNSSHLTYEICTRWIFYRYYRLFVYLSTQIKICSRLNLPTYIKLKMLRPIIWVHRISILHSHLGCIWHKKYGCRPDFSSFKKIENKSNACIPSFIWKCILYSKWWFACFWSTDIFNEICIFPKKKS